MRSNPRFRHAVRRNLSTTISVLLISPFAHAFTNTFSPQPATEFSISLPPTDPAIVPTPNITTDIILPISLSDLTTPPAPTLSPILDVPLPVRVPSPHPIGSSISLLGLIVCYRNRV